MMWKRPTKFVEGPLKGNEFTYYFVRVMDGKLQVYNDKNEQFKQEFASKDLPYWGKFGFGASGDGLAVFRCPRLTYPPAKGGKGSAFSIPKPGLR